MYKHVLVPVALDHGAGFSPAFQLARLIAGPDGKVSAVTVVEPIPGFARQYLPEGEPEKRLEDALAKLQKIVPADQDVDCKVVVGHPGRRIVDYAETIEADCIIISSHRPGMQDYFLGSTAGRVVRHSPCAVHVMR